MEQLKDDWLTEGLIDFEFKKYLLLSYLQGIRLNFKSNKLYPYLSDLIFHYRNLIRVKENKKILQNQFPQKITKADFRKLKLTYKKIVEDDDLMQELEQIVNFSLSELRPVMREGKEIYDFVENQIEIIPIGLSSLYRDEGYLLVSMLKLSDIQVYKCRITMFEGPNENYRGINTTYLTSFTKSISNTYEGIKLSLCRSFSDFSNPATYAVESKMAFPLTETVLPIAKRLLIKAVSMQ